MSRAALRPLALLLACLGALGASTAFADLEVGVDTSIEGNAATELGSIDSCIEIAAGDTVEIDIYATEVDELLAWSASLNFDPAIVNVTDRDVQLFLASAPDANVFDTSATTPDSIGRYSVGGANTGDSPEPASGSGVLARVTLEGVGPGVSPLSLTTEDVNGDGTADSGVLLKTPANESIADEDGDSFYDGTINNGAVAVDASCDDAGVALSGGGDDDDDSSLWIVALVAAVAIAAVAVAGLFVLRRRRS